LAIAVADARSASAERLAGVAVRRAGAKDGAAIAIGLAESAGGDAIGNVLSLKPFARSTAA
jgi:hypothetical protein